MPEDAYLKLSRRERFELLDAGSRAAGLAPAILEKDYWVCRSLDVLFAVAVSRRQLAPKKLGSTADGAHIAPVERHYLLPV